MAIYVSYKAIPQWLLQVGVHVAVRYAEGIQQLLQYELPCNAIPAEYPQSIYSNLQRYCIYETYIPGLRNLDVQSTNFVVW